MLPRPSPAHSPARPSSQQQPSSAQPSRSHNNNAMLPPPTTSIDRITPHAAQLYYRGHYSPSVASLLLLLLLGRRSSPMRLHNTSTIVITWSSSDDTFKGCPFEATRSVYFSKKHSLLLRKVQECLGSNLAVAASTLLLQQKTTTSVISRSSSAYTFQGRPFESKQPCTFRSRRLFCFEKYGGACSRTWPSRRQLFFSKKQIR
jgi:hypothetical protein